MNSFNLALKLVAQKLHRHLLDRDPQIADAETQVDISSLLGDAPRLSVIPRKERYADIFPVDTIEQIKAANLDVLIRLGFRVLRGEILTAAEFGVWSYHHGDNQQNRGGPPGFWETIEASPVTGATLQILSDDLDNGQVLARTWSTTARHSLADNRNGNYWNALSLLPRKLCELHECGPEVFFDKINKNHGQLQFYSGPLLRAPESTAHFWLLLKQLMQKIKNAVDNRLFFDQWIMLFDLRRDLSSLFRRYHKLTPPKEYFWADPFPIERNERFYIFFEELPFATWKGHISVIELNDKGEHEAPIKILERPYHLSFPFLFEYKDTLYMIPETLENRTIELYVCTNFPYQWAFKRKLMDNVRAADATVFEHAGRWWMFVGMAENEHASLSNELYLFHADNPISNEWTAHPQNPVVSDCRNARPAGGIFEHKGKLYRPSQNSSGHYGRGLNLNIIEELTEARYRETTVSKNLPNWDKKLRSLHTFNHIPGLSVIDAQIRRPRFWKG